MRYLTHAITLKTLKFENSFKHDNIFVLYDDLYYINGEQLKAYGEIDLDPSMLDARRI